MSGAMLSNKYRQRVAIVLPLCLFFSRYVLLLYSAMYKGDMRTRTVGIYVDGVRATTWTSSGLTTDFESVMLGVNGKTVELRGVLEESEWLSIMEVRAVGGRFSINLSAGPTK